MFPPITQHSPYCLIFSSQFVLGRISVLLDEQTKVSHEHVFTLRNTSKRRLLIASLLLLASKGSKKIMFAMQYHCFFKLYEVMLSANAKILN